MQSMKHISELIVTGLSIGDVYVYLSTSYHLDEND